MGPAWYRARSELRLRWRGFAALALLVGLAGGVCLAAVAGARRTASSYDRFREETLAADAFFTSDTLDAGVLEAALDHPTVASYSEALLFLGSPGGPSDFALVTSADGGYGSAIDRPRVLEGRRPDPRAEHEVAVNEETVTQLGVGVGSAIELETFSVDQFESIEEGFSGRFEGPTVELSVVGVVRAPDDLGGVPMIGALGTPAFARRYDGRIGAIPGLFVVDLVHGAADLPAFEEGLRRSLPAGEEWGIESAADSAEPVRDALSVLSTGLVLFAACAGIAGAVAGGQALSRQLASAPDDQLALAALGTTRIGRVLATFIPAAAVALGGATVAVVVAVAASPLFPIGLARKAEPDLGFVVDVPALALGFGAVTAVVCCYSLVAAWSVSALGRHAVGTPARRPSVLAAFLARAGSGPRAVIGVRMALEPGRGRTSVPVRPALVGAVAGITGLVAAVTFGSSLGRLVDTPERWGWSFDLAPDSVEGGADAAQYAGEPGVADVGVVDVAFVRVDGEGAQGHALEAVEGSPSLAVGEGRAPTGAGEIALGRSLLDRLGKDVGDTVALDPAGGSGDPLDYRVVGTATFPTWDDFSSGFAEGAMLTAEGLDRARQSDGNRKIVIGLDEGDDGAARLRLVEGHPGSFPIYALPRPPREVSNLAQLDALPGVLGAFLVALAVAAVAHALVVAVHRRRRDLALLRSIGFLRADVRGVVAWQASVLAGVGVVAGIPLGLAAGSATWAMVARSVGVLDDPSFPITTLVVLPFAALAVANLLGALPARTAVHAPPTAALRAE